MYRVFAVLAIAILSITCAKADLKSRMKSYMMHYSGMFICRADRTRSCKSGWCGLIAASSTDKIDFTRTRPDAKFGFMNSQKIVDKEVRVRNDVPSRLDVKFQTDEGDKVWLTAVYSFYKDRTTISALYERDIGGIIYSGTCVPGRRRNDYGIVPAKLPPMQ